MSEQHPRKGGGVAHADTNLFEKGTASGSDNRTKAINMDQGVLFKTTEKTPGNLVHKYPFLVAPPARGSQGVATHGHLVEKELLGSVRNFLKTATDTLDKTQTGGQGSDVQRRETNIFVNEIEEPVATVREGLVPVDPRDNDLVNLRASAGGGGDKSAIRKTAKTPKIDGSRIPVLRDEHIVFEVREGKRVIIG